MDWVQVLAIVLPVMFAIVIGLIYNNRRLGDVNRRFDDLRTDLNNRFTAITNDMNNRFTSINGDIKELKTDVRDIRNLMIGFFRKESGMG